jgi:hypothetical protein
MDKNFLEFWGNLLISIARGQRQLDDTMRWASQGFPGTDELINLLGKVYGLSEASQAPISQEGAGRQLLDRFHQSYREYLKLMDVVPRAECQKLQEENDALKKRIGELERLIGDLRSLSAEKIPGTPGEAMEEFQKSFVKYLERLQEVMIPFVGVSKGAAVKETDQSIKAENEKR